MEKKHVLVIPYPAQGHVLPLMEVAQCLVSNGLRVTFVNTESNHERVVKAFFGTSGGFHEYDIDMVSIPDGCESMEERCDIGTLEKAMNNVMPGELEILIRKCNEKLNNGEQIACVVADFSMGWAMNVAEKLGLKRAAFLTASAALVASAVCAQKLVDDGVFDQDGVPQKIQMFQFAPTMPIMSTSHFVSTQTESSMLKKLIFDIMKANYEATKSAEWVICNSVYDLEPGAFALVPSITPVGPVNVLATNRLGDSFGHLWELDLTCLKWLDKQKANSVIYVAFGSSTKFEPAQFHELALGLELTHRPFLWAVRPEIIAGPEGFPEGFLKRVESSQLGMITGWAPQRKVLSHPSIACFVTHCGWNSTIESVSNGVPLLCWPYAADQFMNRSYICDIWKVGLGFEKNDTNGIITSQEIKIKVDQLMLGEDTTFKEIALNLKNVIISGTREGGNSYKNLNNFINWIKD